MCGVNAALQQCLGVSGVGIISSTFFPSAQNWILAAQRAISKMLFWLSPAVLFNLQMHSLTYFFPDAIQNIVLLTFEYLGECYCIWGEFYSNLKPKPLLLRKWAHIGFICMPLDLFFILDLWQLLCCLQDKLTISLKYLYQIYKNA